MAKELQERRKADSEPVGWTDEQELRDVEKDGCGYLFKANPITPHADPRRVILLYRHAQPAPVVPEEKPIPNTLSMYAVDAVAAIAEVKGWNACRAAMLKENPVCTCPSGDGSLRWPCPVHPGNSLAIGIDVASGPDRTVEVRYVAPPGYVMVPKEPTEAMMLHNSGCQHHAWDDLDCAMRQTRRLIWSHMLAAAPQKVK
ncbi:hypothetical protein [Klebsiella pneumoniae]|uniref:hypothetical protein n=1 Tax=Klebsiella pneumoniae TaxID=573 RepID=UPI00238126AC|nr:hypothetical protein [Klebsiella pneumoniae]MDE4813122.1 hypothetical protein [Klebsiella pneumoniae]